MPSTGEFHYRIPRRLGAWRPGSHPATSLGAGQEFVSHTSLFDRPDPRRLDLRASLRDLRGDWLIRVNRQRAAVAVQVIVDVSASMAFGERRPKLHIVADFVEALGQSAFRAADALGMSAFDSAERMDLFVPALQSRGSGALMASLLRGCDAGGNGATGLEAAALRFAGRSGLVFLVSDFLWPLEPLAHALDLLSHAFVVPVVVWDRAEVEAPAFTGMASLRDVESGAQRTLWIRPKMRDRWSEGVEQRRAELRGIFSQRAMRPFFAVGEFDSDAMTRYFLEATA
jgi:hypothetical protein